MRRLLSAAGLVVAGAGSVAAQNLPETGTRTVPDLLERGGVVEATGALGETPLIYIRVEGAAPELWLCRTDYESFAAFADPLRSVPPTGLDTVCTQLR